MKKQQIVTISGDYSKLDSLFFEKGFERILLVCGNSIKYLNIGNYFKELGKRKKIVLFQQFQSNPKYESIEAGIELFCKEKCDSIIAVGGGSAMDVAKCIKLYANMSSEQLYIKQPIVENNIPFIAIPTTAGTGSEATRFSVIYYKDEKQSINHKSCIPDIVVFDASSLQSIPEYHRKVTMLDALCHALESYWSINSTKESKKYSKEALKIIMEYKDAYLSNEEEGNIEMLRAANIAGKAINITQTTAGHAMSYKITSLFHIAHGHAVALCVSKVWRYMVENVELCIDTRGSQYLKSIFQEIGETMGVNNSIEAVDRFDEFVTSLGLENRFLELEKEEYLSILKKSVNLVRLKNNPIELDEITIEKLYRQIFDYTGEKNEC